MCVNVAPHPRVSERSDRSVKPLAGSCGELVAGVGSGHGPAVGHGERPDAVGVRDPYVVGMQPVVAAVAEQPAVVDGRRSAALPRDEMVHFADAGWRMTARAATGAISGDDRLALRRGDDPTRAPDVEDLAVRPEHDAGQRAIAGNPVED